MPTILLVGENNLLLKTRAAVLRTTGAATFCSKAASALAVQQLQRCDLIVLCHTVPEADRVSLASAFRRLWPVTPVLLITRTMTWESSDADILHEICSAEPHRLIQRAIQLLEQRPPDTYKPLKLLH